MKSLEETKTRLEQDLRTAEGANEKLSLAERRLSTELKDSLSRETEASQKAENLTTELATVGEQLEECQTGKKRLADNFSIY